LENGDKKKQLNATLSNDLILFSSIKNQTEKNPMKRDSPENKHAEKFNKKLKISSADNNPNPISETIKADNQPIHESDYIAPWISTSTIKIKNSLARLHNEIIDFYNYILPSEEEHNSRLEAITKSY